MDMVFRIYSQGRKDASGAAPRGRRAFPGKRTKKKVVDRGPNVGFP